MSLRSDHSSLMYFCPICLHYNTCMMFFCFSIHFRANYIAFIPCILASRRTVTHVFDYLCCNHYLNSNRGKTKFEDILG